MSTYKVISIYILSYFLFGVIVFLLVFGFADSFKILKSSPLSNDINGTIILCSSLIASVLIIKLMRKRLSLQPYSYFILGFYIGNLSLLLMFLLDALLNNYVVWKFPEFLLLFFAPFIELFISYLFGFAFLALIPSCLSAYILFKVIQSKEKKLLRLGSR
ncbi:hypothetical protein Lqui_2247 [Legionella quinlivanii]|uniref:Uncharacterized protein n=1 Tax=Legionella quinlivanii TaxID=45073 RepID=A0A0W0XU59_9GAMM|nr:hypothetical protein [Legionella quinlivanii]KTD47983.1 hypothetical protein Lqui_2247 [Legionella quinlivanii]MCW8450736.1 hypothetical protein [Legionella quinlivanii]SEG20572.1 hypothetical protein SAMN02746093_02172 [Legionella quinlivanii DSM 21216]STY11094.1 Uncharacterised protein [Legionella quinlivanii]